MRSAAVVGTISVVALTLGGCGSQSPYCEAVDAQQKTLESFDADHTDAGYARYATAVESVAKKAPADTAKEWKAIASATRGVVSAHEQVGFKLEDMDDATKRQGLSEGDIETLNTAYAAFNDTKKQRAAVVADAEKTCDIQLK